LIFNLLCWFIFTRSFAPNSLWQQFFKTFLKSLISFNDEYLEANFVEIKFMKKIVLRPKFGEILI